MRLIPALALLIATSTQASVIGIVTADGGSSIRITREQGPCLGDAKVAQWVSRDALTVVPGCWITDGRMVYISFLDGDRADVPVPMLRAPTSL